MKGPEAERSKQGRKSESTERQSLVFFIGFVDNKKNLHWHNEVIHKMSLEANW